MKIFRLSLYFIFVPIFFIVSCTKEDSPTIIEQPEDKLVLLEFDTTTVPVDKNNVVSLLPIPELQWTIKNVKQGEKINFSVRIGTSENNMTTIAVNHTLTTLQLDFLLTPETTYYWQVVLKNRDDTETHSPVYEFTTSTIEFNDSVIEQIVRDVLLKPEGGFTMEELSSIIKIPSDTTISDYQALSPYESIESLSGLQYCSNLERLNLYQNGFRSPISDINPISNIKSLKYLNLANNQVHNISGLANLTNLEYLHLGWNIGISDITPLTKLHKLKTLNLTYTYGIKDLTPLTSLSQLDSLLMTTARYVEDATPISELTNLKKLSFTSNDIISDFSFLENLTELRDLSLYSNDSISDISFLSGMTKLTKLNISRNKVTDISVLENLTDLEYLELNDLKISDFSVLINLIKLKEVWLHDNVIDENIISIQELKQALPNTIFYVNAKFVY